MVCLVKTCFPWPKCVNLLILYYVVQGMESHQNVCVQGIQHSQIASCFLAIVAKLRRAVLHPTLFPRLDGAGVVLIKISIALHSKRDPHGDSYPVDIPFCLGFATSHAANHATVHFEDL